MRNLAAATILLICCGEGAAREASAASKQSQATAAFDKRITTIASQAVLAEVSKHPERLNGVSMKLRFTVDQSGRVHNVRVVSGKPERWAEKTAARALAAVEFPPIPKNVLQDMGKDHIEAEAEVSYQVKWQPPAWDVNSAYYKYNMRVHKMLQEEIKPAFSAQAVRLEVDYEFYLDSQGRVTSLKVHSKAGGQRAEQIIARSVRALKFPPVPAQVFKDLEQQPPLRIFGTMTWDP